MRIIYNTTFMVNEDIANEWSSFMKESYIGDLSKTGRCSDILFTRVSIDQPDSKTFSLQLFFKSETELNDFIGKQLPPIEEKMIGKYANCYLCFSSILTEL